jgi:hypothetical protein
LGVILEAGDESTAGLPFGCFLTQIIHQSGINVNGEPKMKIQQPISKQTLMKSNAQLQRDDSDDEVPPPTTMPVGFPNMASSSHTVPPSEPEVNYAQIMKALEPEVNYAHVLHVVSCALHRQVRGAEPAGPLGVPEVSSS